MNETELLAAVRRDIDASSGSYYERINYERAKALRYYMGLPYGNEMDGRSKIITTEVQDTIEAMLPQILKPFISSESVVYFDPVGPEDEQAAKQETQYVNHVFYKENEGLKVLYDWAKDGLMSKNGILKYYWEDKERKATESYTGLNDEDLMLLLSDDDVEVIEQTEETEIEMVDGMSVAMTTYDVKVKRTESSGQVLVMNIPPEEFLIDSEWNELNLQNVPFCAHETYTTLSDLRARGYDTTDIEPYAGSVARKEYDNLEQQERFKDISEDYFNVKRDQPADPSMRRIKLTEVYKRIDYDGDGHAELRRILLVNETHILDNEEIDYVPFEAWTPIPMTHRFYGRSAADQTMDLQLQKSMLTRNILDNLYLINNTRHAVVEGEVNLQDALDSKPGGVVRMSSPGMMQPLPTQPFTGHAFGMLEYLDSIKENRTGVTRYNQGIDADSLNKTAAGITRIMDASAQRLEMIARLFGEAVKRLMLGMHRLLLQNQDKEKVVQLRGQWVPINPMEWRERTNMTVLVGLGTENRDRMLGHLMTLYQMQKEIVLAGSTLVNEMNLYNTLSKIVENAGLKNPELYITDPSSVPPRPPQPDPQMEMVKGQLAVAQQDNQVKAQKVQSDYDVDLRKLMLDERKVSLEERRLALEEMQIQMASADEALQAEVDARQAEMEAQGALNG